MPQLILLIFSVLTFGWNLAWFVEADDGEVWQYGKVIVLIIIINIFLFIVGFYEPLLTFTKVGAVS